MLGLQYLHLRFKSRTAPPKSLENGTVGQAGTFIRNADFNYSLIHRLRFRVQLCKEAQK